MVEEGQVGGEEDAGREGEHALTPRPRPLAALLPPGERDERRDGEGRAVRGGGRRRDGREDDEDAAEGDAHGAGHDGSESVPSPGAAKPGRVGSGGRVGGRISRPAEERDVEPQLPGREAAGDGRVGP